MQGFVIFSSVDWGTQHQMHHQLANSLIDRGFDVLFVENTGVRSINLHDSSRVIDRIKSRLNSFHGFWEPKNNLTIFSPLLIPLPYSRLANHINSYFVTSAINKWLLLKKINRPIIITFLPTPIVHKLIKVINFDLVIYYCANHMAGSSNSAKKLRVWEDRMFVNADLVFSIANDITNRALNFRNQVGYFPPGVDLDNFAKINVDFDTPILKTGFNNVIGYIGAISNVFDKDLILSLSKDRPKDRIAIVGPVHTDISLIKNQKNIIFTGEVPHDCLINYGMQFNCALIPYVKSDYTDSVNTCKLNEYLAMGLPVVSTNIKQNVIFSQENKDVVKISHSKSEFIDLVGEVLDKQDNKSLHSVEERKKIARLNSWDDRFLEIYDVIKNAKYDPLKEKKSLLHRLSSFYRKRNRKFYKLFFIIFSVYLLLFQSPMFWLLGEQLVMRDSIEKSEAMVVFTGDGEVGYKNSSYQRRMLDSLNIYNKGYSQRIYISSGREQNIPDVNVVKLLLINSGVNKDDIFISNKYPSSTAANVIIIRDKLRADGINSIIFVTSPYHAKRAYLTWKKQAPDINIVVPRVIDTQKSAVQWSSSLKEIYVIIYEYIAIIHNWLNNRI